MVYAHRGASADAPENTLPAFELARQQGADGIECDLRFAAGGQIVVCHDETLGRLAGIPEAVRDLSLDELRELPILASRFPDVAASIPTLDEAVAVAGPQMIWNLELKVDRHEDAEPLALAAVRAIADLPLLDRVIVSSFHPLALLTVRKAAPLLPTAWLWEADGPLGDFGSDLFGRLCATVALHPESKAVTPTRLLRWHRRGMLVNTWTVDDPAELRRLRAWGVDGVITNRPAEALRVFGRS